MAPQLAAVEMIIDKNQKDYIPFQEQMSSKSRWRLKETKMFFSYKYFYDKKADINRETTSLCETCWQIFIFEESWFSVPSLELALRHEQITSFVFTDTEKVKSAFCNMHSLADFHMGKSMVSLSIGIYSQELDLLNSSQHILPRRGPPKKVSDVFSTRKPLLWSNSSAIPYSTLAVV